MLRFAETKVTIEKFYTEKKHRKIWDVNIDNIVFSQSVKTKTNSKYLTGYLDKVIGPLVLIMSKMSGYIKTFKVKDGDKDENNKLISFHIDDEKLLEKYKAISTKIEDLQNIELNFLLVFDDSYIKIKMRTYVDKVCTNFRGLNVPEDDIECESFTMISSVSLLVYKNKYYLQVYLGHCVYKIANKQMTDYLVANLFED